ncbi:MULTISPECIES: PA2779 family protein [Desulfosediminicola]|uniref:PA2779 family protein n=1 Tax=Desulfosediminicola TaxID=2886823 RepID=UPI0010AD7772|nr:PA2779 family protein [Desulfosediminicola ganghwensis]
MNSRCKKSIIFFTLLQFFLVSGSLPGAKAALISTHTMIESEKAQSTEATREQIREILTHDDVTQELVRLGVDPAKAEERIAALSPAELEQLQSRIGELPAGAGVIEVLGITFLVLLVLDLLGVTNVFSKI